MSQFSVICNSRVFKNCQGSWFVVCDRPKTVSRGITAEQARTILDAQMLCDCTLCTKKRTITTTITLPGRVRSIQTKVRIRA